eukprot:CAMPEP_0185851208 /NCGR_PEP_ID=MMETSP1354-20130828/7581_1 /TAXON_ID=708628 /ORGANISM="Erythrolobus madagascarensis, Strain CCMP3276" /LENGTH=129 /DNA_ID=CAMNT_0028552137 /DNA_START=120 /DNA_END=505 /DNA_ORIENTATION=-
MKEVWCETEGPNDTTGIGEYSSALEMSCGQGTLDSVSVEMCVFCLNAESPHSFSELLPCDSCSASYHAHCAESFYRSARRADVCPACSPHATTSTRLPTTQNFAAPATQAPFQNFSSTLRNTMQITTSR